MAWRRSENEFVWLRRGVLALLIVGAAVALTVTFSDGHDVRPNPPMRVEVKRVRGGDAVLIEPDDKLVYAGIRAPRRGETLFDEARRRNAELVSDKELRLRFDKCYHDDKGRLLAYAYVEQMFVNEALVREGLAYVRLTPQTRRFADDLLAAQAEARKRKLGIWALPAPEGADRYLANAHHGNFHRPDCEETSRIRPENLVVFDRRGAAFDEGFAPCDHCLP